MLIWDSFKKGSIYWNVGFPAEKPLCRRNSVLRLGAVGSLWITNKFAEARLPPVSRAGHSLVHRCSVLLSNLLDNSRFWRITMSYHTGPATSRGHSCYYKVYHSSARHECFGTDVSKHARQRCTEGWLTYRPNKYDNKLAKKKKFQNYSQMQLSRYQLIYSSPVTRKKSHVSESKTRRLCVDMSGIHIHSSDVSSSSSSIFSKNKTVERELSSKVRLKCVANKAEVYNPRVDVSLYLNKSGASSYANEVSHLAYSCLC